MESPKITLVRRLFEEKHISLQEMLILLTPESPEDEGVKYAIYLNENDKNLLMPDNILLLR